MPSKTGQIVYPKAKCWEATCEPDKQGHWCSAVSALLTPVHTKCSNWIWTQGSDNSCVVLCFPARLWRESSERQKFPILLHRCISSNENISRGLEIHFQSKTAFSALFPKYCNAAILHWETLRCSQIILPSPHSYEWLWFPHAWEKDVGHIEVEAAQNGC